MKKYYETPKTSETGLKLQAIHDKAKKCKQAQIEMANKYGFKKWRMAYWAVFGGISAVLFEDKPDENLWKYSNGEYSPRRNKKEGKAIQAEFDALPTVSNEELNACIGYDEFMSTIGVKFNNSCFFGFCVNSDDFDDIPSDCEEITGTEYEEL